MDNLHDDADLERGLLDVTKWKLSGTAAMSLSIVHEFPGVSAQFTAEGVHLTCTHSLALQVLVRYLDRTWSTGFSEVFSNFLDRCIEQVVANAARQKELH